MNLLSQLNQCDNISEFSEFIENLHAAPIGLFGGRRFYQEGQSDTVCMNDVVKRLNEVYQNTVKDDTNQENFISVITKINQLDWSGHFKVSQSFILKRIFTGLRQWLGNRGYDRNKILNNIKNTVEQHLKFQLKSKAEIQKKEQEKLKKIQEEELLLNNKPISHLIEQIELLTDTEFAQLDNENNEPSEKIQNYKKLLSILTKKIKNQLSKNSTQEIKDAFQAVKGDPKKFELLAHLVSESSNLRVYDTTQFLEALDWPSEKMKNETIPHCVVKMIGIQGMSGLEGMIFTKKQLLIKNQNFIPIYSAFLDMRKIFGTGDFNKNPLTITPLLAKGIAQLFRQLGELAFDELKKNGNKECGGLQIRIGQFMECRFPASMISSILPHLKNIPALVSIDFNDIGTGTAFNVHNPYPPQAMKKGFGNENAPAILEMIEENPFLIEIQINHDGMTDKDQSDVHSAVDAVNNNPNKQEVLDNLLIQASE